MAINSFTGALTALALNLSPNPYAVTEIVFWLLGSLADRSLPYVWLVTPLTIIGWGLLLAAGPALDGLSLGNRTGVVSNAVCVWVDLSQRVRAYLFDRNVLIRGRS